MTYICNMKTTIKKSELEKIYNIACKDWKNKIVDYTKRNPFGDTIDFKESEIKEMLSAATQEQLPTVKEVFEVTSSFESIKTVEDAIKYLGEKDEEVKTLESLRNAKIPRHIVAEQELVVIVKAVNDGWVADYANHNQYKFYPWWYLGKDFRLYYVDFYYSHSVCSARLVLESIEKAEYVSSQFKHLYKEYLNN